MMMMMAEKEDLGLSLSLSFPQDQQNKQLAPSSTDHHKLPWIHHHPFSPLVKASSGESCRSDAPVFLRGIDVNRSVDCEEEEEDLTGVSSPNSTVSSVSGKRLMSEREPTGSDELETERASSRGIASDEEDYGDNARKKLRLSKDQSAVLEESFKEHSTLNPKQKLALAKQLGLRPRQVEVWFQNRRARTKLKQTEIDCEFLKRCCENLTEENRRLQKEVQELRALKLSPQFYMQMAPPTTLTMCPSCERVGAPPAAAAGLNSRPVTAHHRPMPFNPWAQAVPIAHSALRPRS